MQSQTDILDFLQKQHQQLEVLFSSIPETDFFAVPSGKWSIAQHVGHLSLTQSRIAFGFTIKDKLPSHTAPSRSFDEIQILYTSTVARANGAGLLANNPFTAQLEPDTTQAAIIAGFSSATAQLVAAVSTWQAAELEQYAMKHPLLGLLSAKEMLFFSGYHNTHHEQGIRALML